MFEINYKSNGWKSNKTIKVIDKEYALLMFNQLLEAVDLAEVYLLDGFTGEILFEWAGGRFKIIDGIILGR